MLQLVVLFDVDDTLWWATPRIANAAAGLHTNPWARVINLPLLEAFCDTRLVGIDIQFHMLTAYDARAASHINVGKQGRDGETFLTRDEIKTHVKQHTRDRIEIDAVITTYDAISQYSPGSYYQNVIFPIEQSGNSIISPKIQAYELQSKVLLEQACVGDQYLLKQILFKKVHQMYVTPIDFLFGDIKLTPPIYIFIDDKQEYLNKVQTAATELNVPLCPINALKDNPNPAKQGLRIPKTTAEYLCEILAFVNPLRDQLLQRVTPAPYKAIKPTRCLVQ